MLDFTLTPEQEELKRTARAFALREVLPVAWHFDEINEIPMFVLKKAFDCGLMNGDIPQQFGGKGYGRIESVIITEEIAAACPGLATSIFANSLGMEPLFLSGNQAVKKTYFRLIRDDFKLICFATSEPLMGSDVAGLRLKAEKDGDSYVLNGTKYWISNGGIADYVSVFATVDPEAAHRGICAFLVETAWPGVSVSPPIPKMGQRCSNTAGIRFDNVRVPEKNMLAAPGDGFVLAMKTFSRTRPIIAAFAVGAARAAMDYAIDYAKKRRAFGMKLKDFQAIQFKIAEMYQKVETARLLAYKAAWEADSGMDPTTSASIAKLYATEAANEVADEALQIFAGYGYTKSYPIEKLLRDIRLLKIYEGTSEIQRNILSAHVLTVYEPAMPPLEDLPMLRGGQVIDAENGPECGPAWRCRICGHIHNGDAPPEQCPYCFFPGNAFKQVWPPETDRG